MSFTFEPGSYYTEYEFEQAVFHYTTKGAQRKRMQEGGLYPAAVHLPDGDRVYKGADILEWLEAGKSGTRAPSFGEVLDGAIDARIDAIAKAVAARIAARLTDD